MWQSLWQRLFRARLSGTVKRPSPRPRRTVLRLEYLEDRLTPSNDFTATISGTTLTVTESQGFNITIANSGTFQEFTITSSSGETATTTSPVRAITVNLGASSSSSSASPQLLTLAGTASAEITLPGGLTITGSTGNKEISADQVYLPGSAALNITLSGTGTEDTTFTDSNIGGAATVSHTGTGNTTFTITTSSSNATETNNWGSLSITNGTGSDVNTIQDTDFSGSVTINNGAGATGDTSQFGGSHNVFSALNNNGLLSITGGLSISTTSGQSDSEVYDYNVQGGVNINAGAGITGQTQANFIGLENNQTTSGSGLPDIGGNTVLSGTAVAGLSSGLTVDVGGSTGNDFPIALHGNLTIDATGSGAANVTLNDISAASSSTTAINLGTTTASTTSTSNDIVNVYGDQATATFGTLNVTSFASGTNTVNLQTQDGTLYIAGSSTITFNAGTDKVNVGSDANTGVIQTVGAFGVSTAHGDTANITTVAQDGDFGGLNFQMYNGNATTTFTDDNVSGAATVDHTGTTGTTNFTIGVNSTYNTNLLNNWNSLSITNGTASDTNSITDTDFGGNVAIVNGTTTTNNTGGFGGSQTSFSAAKNQGLLTVSGSLSIATSGGPSNTQVYDYNVHGGLDINAGNGITGGPANFIGIENKQTVAGSGMPVIGGSSTISGGGPAGTGLTIEIGTNGSSDYPIALHGNLAIDAGSATGSAAQAFPVSITLDDINGISGTTDSISLGSNTSGDVVNIFGDKTTATLGSLTLTSAATGANTINLQTQQGTLDFAGTGGTSGEAMFSFSNGIDSVNVGSDAEKGIVQTAGNFGVGGAASSITTTAANSTFGGLNFDFTGTATAIPTTTFTDVNVTGPATVTQNGTTSFTVATSGSNTNALNTWDNLTITGGTGSDNTSITDTDFTGNVTINTGAGATNDTAQFGGSHTVLSAANNKGLLTIDGNLSISTTSGQSDSEVYDYNVHGSVSITTGAGIKNQADPNLVGIEDHQTNKGSGVPVIGGSVTINGTTVAASTASAGPNLAIDLGTDGSSSGDFPLDILGSLTITAAGTGAATIDANDLNVANGTTTITLNSTTSNDQVSIQGQSVTSVYDNLTITSNATGDNTFALQDAKGTMQVTGVAKVTLGPGNDTLDLAADSGNPNGFSGATLEFFGTTASTFNGGGGTNQLFGSGAVGNTLFFTTKPTVENFGGASL